MISRSFLYSRFFPLSLSLRFFFSSSSFSFSFENGCAQLLVSSFPSSFSNVTRKISINDISYNNWSTANSGGNAIVVVSFFFLLFFLKTEKLRFLFVRTNAWTALKTDGNLGFLCRVSRLPVSMLSCCCVMLCICRYGTNEKRKRLWLPDFLEIVSTTDREKNFYGNAMPD